jgi:glutamate-5-semialdehyde dehydrogenase
MTDDLLHAAREARRSAPPLRDERYGAFCLELGRRLEAAWPEVREANERDLAAAEEAGLGPALLDRLALGDRDLVALVRLAAAVAERRRDAVLPRTPRPAAGAVAVRQVPKPIGTILMIYEARPTVTVEGALLPVATGNAVLLRGGREIAHTNGALGVVIADALVASGLPAGMAQVVAATDRRAVRELLQRHDAIDLLVPRGSPSLIDYCLSSSTIPVIASGGGVNHLYVHGSADIDLVASVAIDSKVDEPTACNTLDMVLADADRAGEVVRRLVGHPRAAGMSVLLDPLLAGTAGAPGRGVRVGALQASDDGREFLDRTIGVRPVSGPDAALDHVRRHGSGHTEGIAARDPDVIERYCEQVDAAAIVVNGSLRLHDGPTMRLGPELSISTGRVHVRGPVTLEALVTWSWLVEGNGVLRSDLAGQEPA